VSLSEDELLADIRQRLFSPLASSSPRAVGMELELIPVHRSSKRAVPIRDESAPMDSERILSRVAAHRRWVARANDGDPASWTLPNSSVVSFEPGGQLEISGAPAPTASEAIRSMVGVVESIRDEMSRDEVDLVAAGVDPYNDIDAVPLQLRRNRYTHMNRFFDSIGPSGARMMRQTAALQINLERGADPPRRWRLLNALAPVVIALFANSARYAGAETGWASYRSYLWRTLDNTRTGLAYSEDVAVGYLEFALDALAIESGDGDGDYRSFRDWMRSNDIGRGEWSFHLSTLFPEIRPREYFELRSPDTIEPEYLAAPIVFVTGLVYAESAAEKAEKILGAPDPTLLEAAGRVGLDDPRLRDLALRLAEISLDAGASMGNDYISGSHVHTAAAYFARRLNH
jgi:glutamate--cysteine ligase